MKITKTNKRLSIIFISLTAIILLALYPLPPQTPIHYYDRESGELKTEKVAAEKWLVWLYNNPVGEATLGTLAKRKMVSSIYGTMMDSPSSKKKIQPFVDAFDIDMKAVQKKEFDSFNDFFTRKLNSDARAIDTTSNIVVSPADGKLLAYADITSSDFMIKGYRFNVLSFLDNADLAQHYLNGTLVIVRLAPSDYHRFHFPISGSVSPSTHIDGDYYSVNPLALRKKAEILCLNKREYTIIKNPLYGEVIMAEVGATMVGSIIQTYSGDFVNKGDEKGYFKFGGSTVVLLFQKDKIRINNDLLTHSLKGYETSIKEGESIGISLMTL